MIQSHGDVNCKKQLRAQGVRDEREEVGGGPTWLGLALWGGGTAQWDRCPRSFKAGWELEAELWRLPAAVSKEEWWGSLWKWWENGTLPPWNQLLLLGWGPDAGEILTGTPAHLKEYEPLSSPAFHLSPLLLSLEGTRWQRRGVSQYHKAEKGGLDAEKSQLNNQHTVHSSYLVAELVLDLASFGIVREDLIFHPT